MQNFLEILAVVPLILVCIIEGSLVFQDCIEVYENHHASGVYDITMPSGETFKVYCDEGWLSIQSRGQFGNPIHYFNQSWNEVLEPFGEPDKEFWIGLDNMFDLTNDGKPMSLKILLEGSDGLKAEVTYQDFRIYQKPLYKLNVSGFASSVPSVGDSMSYHLGMSFSTFDNDNDGNGNGNCAILGETGPWWHKSCFNVMLNGPNLNSADVPFARGIHWTLGYTLTNSLRSAQMLIRQKACTNVPLIPTTNNLQYNDDRNRKVFPVGILLLLECKNGCLKQNDVSQENWKVTCGSDGSWQLPDTWPVCIKLKGKNIPPVFSGKGCGVKEMIKTVKFESFMKKSWNQDDFECLMIV